MTYYAVIGGFYYPQTEPGEGQKNSRRLREFLKS